MKVRIKWARNTAVELGRDSAIFDDVEAVDEPDGTDGETIELRRGPELVARFGRHDADVLVVEE